MEYLIKKINMIDILGMMCPGGLMLLLMESDIHLLAHLKTALNIQEDKVLWGIVVLGMSYVMGMILHEAGSVIEKILWTNPMMNPRSYAAVSTNMLEHYEEQVDTTKDTMLSTVRSLVVGIVAIGIMLASLWIVLGCERNKRILFIAAAVLAIAALYQGKLCCAVLKLDKAQKNCIRHMISNEKIIMHEMGTTEENWRKFGLFCGYHALFRSLLVMVLILQIAANLTPDTNPGSGAVWLLALDQNIRSKSVYVFLRYAIVLVAVLRYWHYACTRFTYAYNGYLKNKYLKTDAIEEKRKADARIEQIMMCDIT